MAEEERVVPITSSQTADEKSSNRGIEKEKQKNKRKKILIKEADKADMRGVCYLSRVPPHMDPLKLRQILSQYGEIPRLYLTPEDPSAQLHKPVVKSPVDFEDKNSQRDGLSSLRRASPRL